MSTSILLAGIVTFVLGILARRKKLNLLGNLLIATGVVLWGLAIATLSPEI